MTTNPEVLRLAREIADAAVPDVNADHPEQTTRRVMWDMCRLSAIAAIEKTTELAITHLRSVYGLPHYGLQQFEHIERHRRQSEKDNSDAE